MAAIREALESYDELESLIVAAYEPKVEDAFQKALRAIRGYARPRPRSRS
jgi:hypothetical protein